MASRVKSASFTVVTDMDQVPILVDVNLAVVVGSILVNSGSPNSAAVALGHQLMSLRKQIMSDNDDDECEIEAEEGLYQ